MSPPTGSQSFTYTVRKELGEKTLEINVETINGICKTLEGLVIKQEIDKAPTINNGKQALEVVYGIVRHGYMKLCFFEKEAKWLFENAHAPRQRLATPARAMMEEGGASGHHADEDFNVVLQSLQRDINCLTAKDRAVRKQAITKLHKALVACTKVGAEPQRRFVVPKNPVALRSEAGLKSAPRNFTLKRGDVVLLLEQREVEGRQRVRFEKNGVDCWASINAGDGGVLLQETEPLMPDTVGGVAPKAGMLEYLLGKMLGKPCRQLGIGCQTGTFRTHRLTLGLPTG